MLNGRLAGVALRPSALALLFAVDALVKRLTAHCAVPQLMRARFLFSLPGAAPVIRIASGGPASAGALAGAAVIALGGVLIALPDRRRR